MLILEANFSEAQILCKPEKYETFCLFKIIPHNSSINARLPINLALVIDTSGSMHGNDRRLHLAIDAATQAVQQLNPDDIITIISFADDAHLIQSAIPASNLSQIT